MVCVASQLAPAQQTVAQANYDVAVAQLKRAMGMPIDQMLSLADTVTGTADGAILSMRPDELLQLLEGSEP